MVLKFEGHLASGSEIPGEVSMWCWRRIEQISSWTEHVRNEVLQGVKKRTTLLQTIKRRKDNWIGHILLANYLPKQVTEAKIEGLYVTERRGGRRKQLLDDLLWTRRKTDYGMKTLHYFCLLLLLFNYSKVKHY
jgi:hypothetical protein